MTTMTVNETTVPATPPTPAARRRSLLRRLIGRRTVVALGAAVALVLLFHYVLMPWLVRDRVRAALDEAGLRAATFRVTRATLWATDVRDLVLDGENRVDRVRVRYDVVDLWHREVRQITVEGATLSVDPRKWPIEKKKAASTSTATTVPKSTPLSLPFDELRIDDAKLVLPDGRRIEVGASLTKTSDRFRFWLGWPDSGVVVNGSLNRSLDGGRATADIGNISGELIDALLGTYVATPPVAISGKLSGRIAASWGDGPGRGGHVFAALQISGGSLPQASAAKLTLASGVFVGEASVGPSTRRAASVKIDNADLATPDLTARGVGGAVTFVSLNPPVSAPRQKLSAASLKVGNTELKNGQLEFEVNGTGDIFVRQTRWDFLGGQVFANDVRVPRDGPTSFTLTANQVDLSTLLSTYAKDKLAGSGKLSGKLPVVINGRDIRFGEGNLTSLQGGELKVTDNETRQQVADVAGSAAAAQAGSPAASTEQVKRGIAEALQDFEYDQLTARLTNEPDGLAAYIVISGRGRTGAKQALTYEPRIHRLDQLLGLALDIQGATQQRPTTRGAKGKAEVK
jgi:hypothetical protein